MGKRYQEFCVQTASWPRLQAERAAEAFCDGTHNGDAQAGSILALTPLVTAPEASADLGYLLRTQPRPLIGNTQYTVLRSMIKQGMYLNGRVFGRVAQGIVHQVADCCFQHRPGHPRPGVGAFDGQEHAASLVI